MKRTYTALCIMLAISGCFVLPADSQTTRVVRKRTPVVSTRLREKEMQDRVLAIRKAIAAKTELSTSARQVSVTATGDQINLTGTVVNTAEREILQNLARHWSKNKYRADIDVKEELPH